VNNDKGGLTLLGLGLALFVVGGLLISCGIQLQESRRYECTSALATPGVDDPDYDRKAVEFAEGMEACLQE
jgi:hypothetical protein